MGTRSCTILLRTFTKTGIHFATNEVNFTREWSEFHMRMKQVNSKCSSVQLHTNSAIYSLHSRLVWTHLKGKITLISFPKNPALVDAVCFSGQQWSFASVLVGECFINKAQFDAKFAQGLILKDGVVPAIKDPNHESELQTVSETASNVCFVGDRRFSSRHTLAPPTARRLQELGCFRRESQSCIFLL